MAERIVEVEFDDSGTTHGWHGRDSATGKDMRCLLIGYVLEDDKKSLLLAHGLDIGTVPNDVSKRENLCTTRVPRSAIRKVTELRRGKR